MEVINLIKARTDSFTVKPIQPQAPLFKPPAQPASAMRTDKLKQQKKHPPWSRFIRPLSRSPNREKQVPQDGP
jgi:hypothetical protein